MILLFLFVQVTRNGWNAINDDDIFLKNIARCLKAENYEMIREVRKNNYIDYQTCHLDDFKYFCIMLR